MRAGRALARSLLFLLFSTFWSVSFSSNTTIFLPIFSGTSFGTVGEFLHCTEVPLSNYIFVKFCLTSGHLGLLHKRKKHFFFRKISYYSNSSTSFQLDNLLLCGDIHPNPGYGSTSAHDKGKLLGRAQP